MCRTLVSDGCALNLTDFLLYVDAATSHAGIDETDVNSDSIHVSKWVSDGPALLRASHEPGVPSLSSQSMTRA